MTISHLPGLGYLRLQDHMNVLLVAHKVKPAMMTSSALSLKEISVLELIAEEHHCPSLIHHSTSWNSTPELYAGIDQKHLEDLLSAASKKGEERFSCYGRALGYPESAIKAFARESGIGRKRNKSLIDAQAAGIKAPSWLAYISHIPEELDLIAGKVSPSSQEQGKGYQSLIRKTYPLFSRKLEAAFEGHLQILQQLKYLGEKQT